MFGQFVNIAPCANCGGSGNIIKELCGSCSGEGRSQGESTETLDIPAGVSEGNYIPLRGKGNAGRRGGDSGDVLVVIEEKEHPLFIRDNDDVLFELSVSYPEASLGASIEVPTLYGSQSISIEPGTQPGTVIQLKDKGIKHLQANGKGSQHVHINVYVPTSLTSQEKKTIQDLSGSNHINPDRSHYFTDHEQGKKKKSALFDKVKGAFS
jgi:molecular chaperone DnaJ